MQIRDGTSRICRQSNLEIRSNHVRDENKKRPRFPPTGDKHPAQVIPGPGKLLRDFVPNHSNVVHKLHSMVDNSATKRTPVTWTPEGMAAFDKVKGLISRCPLLYFVDDTAPITLMTDASDYGIGGYLFQRVDNVDQPIAFISKSLTEVQLRWATIQKEAYAIFYCCSKLDTLLKDRKFTILTDHANLTS